MRHISKLFYTTFILLFSYCNSNNVEILSTQNDIISFSISSFQKGNSKINIDNRTIDIEVSFDAPLKSLIAKFTTSPKSKLYIDNIEQESEVSVNDFTKPVEVIVIAEDGVSNSSWLVTVTLEEKPKYIVSTLVADFPGNDGISVSKNGDIYVNSNGQLNQWNGTSIYRVSPQGESSLFIDNLPSWPVGSVLDKDENLIVTGWNSPGIITKISPEGKSSKFYSGLGEPSGLELDLDGNLYVMEPPTNTMTKIKPDGTSSTFASGGSFNKASGITYDKNNNLFYVTNWSDGVISKVDHMGNISIFTTLPSANLGPILLIDNLIYITNPNGNKLFIVNTDDKSFKTIGTGVRGNNDGFEKEATFSFPLGVGVSPDKSTIYVSEVSPRGNGRLRIINLFD